MSYGSVVSKLLASEWIEKRERERLQTRCSCERNMRVAWRDFTGGRQQRVRCDLDFPAPVVGMLKPHHFDLFIIYGAMSCAGDFQTATTQVERGN
ncbi:hypothetical protein KFK09_024039 [Dendrobium nobile]|uniref:Uncharacterized protein n=1 Tax=Dendrobium nobile TaxID=94219 RepID=A0A8T3ADQ9_DENNO|nr:hypothetical protein KFK09_024039 [Dendrobium nobile]